MMPCLKFLTLIFMGAWGYAADQDLACRDLYQYACSPGVRDDGTGVADIADPDITAKRHIQINEELNQKVLDSFYKTYSDPNKSYFKKTAMSLFGLKADPDCNSKQPKETERCARKLSLRSLPFFFKALMPETAQEVISRTDLILSEKYEISDLDFFLFSPDFVKVTQSIRKPIIEKLEKQLDEKSAEIEKTVIPEIKKIMIDKLRKHISDPETLQKIEAKITGIQFVGTDCGILNDKQEINLASIMTANAKYEWTSNSLKYCKGTLLQSSSAFSIVSIIGHELSHSIDPCSIAMGPKDLRVNYSSPRLEKEQAEKEYPLKGLIQCLRSEKSIKALQFSDLPWYDRLFFTPKAPYKYANYNGFCVQDQIGESVADWLSAEVLSEYIPKHYPKLSQEQIRTGVGNALRTLCQTDVGSSSYSSIPEHPESRDRINRILMAQPKILKLMGCPPKPDVVYCSPESRDTKSSPTSPNSRGQSVR